MHRSAARAAAVAGSLVLMGAMAAPAHAADAGNTHPTKFDWNNASYILTIRSGGLETFAHIPRDLPQDVGYSFVELTHDTGQQQGQCEAWGRGVLARAGGRGGRARLRRGSPGRRLGPGWLPQPDHVPSGPAESVRR
jgi:hypothetical protein